MRLHLGSSTGSTNPPWVHPVLVGVNDQNLLVESFSEAAWELPKRGCVKPQKGLHYLACLNYHRKELGDGSGEPRKF